MAAACTATREGCVEEEDLHPVGLHWLASRLQPAQKRLCPARLASTLLGENPGPSEAEEQGDHIRAAATIIGPENPARNPTAGPLPDCRVSALIDTGATHNFISRKAAAKAGLKPIKHLTSAVSLINGTELPIAGVYHKTLRITDTNKETRLQTVTLRCVDLHGCDIVLGMLWTTRAQSIFHWLTRELTYRSDDDGPESRVLAPQAFYTSMCKPGARLYAISIDPNPDQPDVVAQEVREEAGIPPEYEDRKEVLSKTKAQAVAEHSLHDLTIDLVKGKEPTWELIYNLSAKELETLQNYLDENLVQNRIRPLTSSAGALVFFVSKKDRSLRLYVDYKGLNQITRKNRYLLPLISEAIDCLSGTKFYTKLDIRDAYHQVQVAEGEEWKTAFRTRYGHYEYTVMPFGLANA
jgi:hypothetical protein